MARATEALAQIPPANLFCIALCVGVYIFQIIADPMLHSYTLCPRNVLFLHEFYRILTSCVFHGGLLHVGFNMMSAAAIGSLLEKRFGTLRHIITVLWGMLLTSATYILVAYLLHVIFGYDELMYRHSLGFSGVLFQLSVLEANLSPNSSRSVFGMVRVPAYLYPWALLVALQVFMPQISFVGHLAGIFVGTLQLYGVLDIFIMPSDEYLRSMEDWPSLRRLTGREGFVRTPAEGSAAMSHVRDPSALIKAVRQGIGIGIKFFKDVLATLRVMIFGYGRANENTNIGLRLGGRGGETLLGETSGQNDDADDDWVGLPSVSSPTEVESRVV
mmetsp:Transcript_7572/g.15805  ORF Transcript_7572/g.15805 Transcript_7572/m.15805 type:complete len:330 (-) Transcript_7572:1397-2386(-)